MAAPTFLELVELHERKWGTSQYPGRPSLADLMHCPIVVMWRLKGRFMFSVHHHANEVNELVYGILTADKTSIMGEWKLAIIFVSQQPIKFKIRIVSDVEAPEAVNPNDVTQPISSYGRDPVPLNRQPVLVPLNRQPELVPYNPRVAKENPQRTPRKGHYIEVHTGIRQHPIFTTPSPHPILPGRNPARRKQSN